MSDPIPSSLPQDVAGCHALIRQLNDELAETRRKLSVYVENERRQMEWRYGKGATHQQVLEAGQKFSFDISHISPQRRREVEEELAAEDAMLRRQGTRRRPRKK